jgi:uracil-DNA glycosylase family 4
MASDDWNKLRNDIKECKACSLCVTRKNVVIGRGSSEPIVLFVGEAPGETEDERGMPFVGRSGLVLDSEIKRIGLSYNDYYICNAIKCRPTDNKSGNRQPTPYEIDKCSGFLLRQIRLMEPKIIVALGNIANDALNHLQLYGENCCQSKIFKFIHPAVTLYKPKMYLVFRESFNMLKKEVDEYYAKSGKTSIF